jgi:hypothetical protein
MSSAHSNDSRRERLAEIANWIERDRREPDKILCHIASLRRELLNIEHDAQGGLMGEAA